MNKVTIYAILDDKKRVIYVGQTRNPELRWKQLKAQFDLVDCKFTTLCLASEDCAGEIEGALIRSFKAFGWCFINENHSVQKWALNIKRRAAKETERKD